jgi:hypothetical protein
MPVSTLEKLIAVINRILLIDVFLVAFFFLWFITALVAESLHWHLGWQVWQSLWQSVIQPAIGLLMLGAIATGVINRFRKPSK